MGQIDYLEYFKTMEPMKYYQPQPAKSKSDTPEETARKEREVYNQPKAREMIDNVDNKFIATLKNDGEWARLIKIGDTVVVQSRNISKKTGEYGDKTASVPHIVEAAKKLWYDFVLIGELCYFRDFEKTSRDVGEILRCLPEEAVQRQENGRKLDFVAFDCLYFKDGPLMQSPYSLRYTCAYNVITELKDKHMFITDRYSSDFSEHLSEILTAGGEGIVIHRKDYLYEPGKRTAWHTLKVKRIVEEVEGHVTALIEPNRDHEGSETDWQYTENGDKVTKVYYFHWKNGVVVSINGVESRVTSGLSDDDRKWLSTPEAQEMLKNGELWATCSCMQFTPDGKMRHPRLIRLRTEH